MIVKFFKRGVGDKAWDEIDENEVHHNLYRENKQTTTPIRDMLNGQSVTCDNFEYKLEMDFGR